MAKTTAKKNGGTKTKTSNGNGDTKNRTTNKERVAAAWQKGDQVWPPALGDRVRLFSPPVLRGRVSRVIAVGETKSKTSTRLAPKDKVRISIKHPEKGQVQIAVGQNQAFPSQFKVKEIETML